MPDEVARIGALSNGSNGQRSLESASLHFEPIWWRERRNAEREPTAEILSAASARRISFERRRGREPELAEGTGRAGVRTRNPERCFLREGSLS
jgi:hypothetical protein